MRALIAASVLLILGCVVGCGPGQTPEEAEAAKYPKAKPLTADEAAKARELAQTRPPSDGQGSR